MPVPSPVGTARSGYVTDPRGVQSQTLTRYLRSDLAPHQVREGGDEGGRIVQAFHGFKLLNAEVLRLSTRFDVDFVQGLDVVGDEGDGHHQHALSAARKRKVNDVGVAKQVVEKRFDGVERVGPTQLKQ